SHSAGPPAGPQANYTRAAGRPAGSPSGRAALRDYRSRQSFVVPHSARSHAGRTRVHRGGQYNSAEGRDGKPDLRSPLLARAKSRGQAHCCGPAERFRSRGRGGWRKERWLGARPAAAALSPLCTTALGQHEPAGAHGERAARDCSGRAGPAAIDPDQPITNVRTVSELMNGSRADPRFMMVLLSIFSAVALALAV